MTELANPHPKFTKAEAIAYADSGAWQDLSDRELVAMQLHHVQCCMPFEVFHGAVERVLGRPVWTHEFAGDGWQRITDEFNGVRGAPSLSEIIGQLTERMGPGKVIVAVQ